jgi:hypothetical protein
VIQSRIAYAEVLAELGFALVLILCTRLYTTRSEREEADDQSWPRPNTERGGGEVCPSAEVRWWVEPQAWRHHVMVEPSDLVWCTHLHSSLNIHLGVSTAVVVPYARCYSACEPAVKHLPSPDVAASRFCDDNLKFVRPDAGPPWSSFIRLHLRSLSLRNAANTTRTVVAYWAASSRMHRTR